MKIPVKVEASRGGSPGYLELDDRYAQLLRDWAELQGYELVFGRVPGAFASAWLAELGSFSREKWLK